MATAAGTTTKWSRHRRLSLSRLGRGAVPYALVAPVVGVMGAILGYPIYSLVRISLQRYGLFELIRHHGVYIGLHNFGTVLHDSVFWHTLLRTLVFAAANVALTLVIGTLIALLLVRLSTWVRLLVTGGLVLVWSTPPVVAVQVWNWMTNVQNGVVNYILTELHVGNYFQHNWYTTSFSQLAMVTTLIVWGALPFVAITVYAALSQVPQELVEAAEIDGARSWRVFLDVTLPVITPVILILTSLSILWDFGVFTQPYLLIGQAHVTTGNYLMGIYLFEEGYVRADFGRGAAISILMLVIVAALSVVYVRRMIKIGEVT
ncbi:MAG: sugar ABC transporter permease [Acidobacteriota bacterium]|nr:sugar ABC transporter permease [Acidobacteriota bacterium]MDE3191371.1 sugar ABC transporter permease [Acidobacteriota bacterium]